MDVVDGGPLEGWGDQNYAARQSGLHQNPLSGEYSGVRCEHWPVSHPIQAMCRSV